MRSLLYLLARLLGDFNAIKRGPRSIATRLIRKTAFRSIAPIINRIK